MREESLHPERLVVMNSAIHHMASAQMHSDALRDALRNPPRVTDEPKQHRSPWRRRINVLYRLRPTFV